MALDLLLVADMALDLLLVADMALELETLTAVLLFRHLRHYLGLGLCL